MSLPKRMKIEIDDGSYDNPPSSSKDFEDWRSNAITLLERQSYALKQGYLTDVTFSVGPEKKLFQAHKMVLSLASPVFEAMFYGSLRETNEVIHITDILPIGFQLLLEFIYTDDLNIISEGEAFFAWIAADKYCLNHMKNRCYRYLYQCSVNENNVWIMLENSLFLDSPSLVHKCMTFLKKSINDAILTCGFLEISSETLKKILTVPSLNIKEIILLRSVVCWAQEKLKNNPEESLQQLLKPFMEHIHFGSMSQKEFVSFIDDHPDLINESDSLAILKFMTNDKQYSLPAWCSHNVYPRKVCESQRQKSVKQASKHIRSYAVRPQATQTNQNSSTYSNDSDGEDLHHPDNAIYRGYNDRRESSLESQSSSRTSMNNSSSDSSSDSDDDNDSRIHPRREYISSSDSSDSSL